MRLFKILQLQLRAYFGGGLSKSGPLRSRINVARRRGLQTRLGRRNARKIYVAPDRPHAEFGLGKDCFSGVADGASRCDVGNIEV